MAVFHLDTRELRSFRFKYYTKELLKNLNSQNPIVTGFMTTDSFYPEHRNKWKEHNLSKTLKIVSMPSQLGRFLFKRTSSEWQNVNNLLKGPLYMLTLKKNNELNLNQINEFLSLKTFYLRFLVVKNQLYRADVILNKGKSGVITNKANVDLNLLGFLNLKLLSLIILTSKIKKE